MCNFYKLYHKSYSTIPLNYILYKIYAIVQIQIKGKSFSDQYQSFKENGKEFIPNYLRNLKLSSKYKIINMILKYCF